MTPAPEGHDCHWRIVELRRDAKLRIWARDECAHGWSGEWFPWNPPDHTDPPPWELAR